NLKTKNIASSSRHVLRLLKPSSKLFREEVSVLNKRSMSSDEWNNVSSHVNDWAESMKKSCQQLREQKVENDLRNSFPVRQFSDDNSKDEELTKMTVQRIKSCDYAKWDKFDPDVEMLKMDINDERQRESGKTKNRSNITAPDVAKTKELANKLSTIERENLANNHRIKGNEFYKAADFQEALSEYTLSIQILPTASAFNNRAITYFKLNDLEMTIADCDQCLQIEPNNVKALVRKAQALLNQFKYREAYDNCEKILSFESENKWAKSKITEIREKIPLLPPKNAFRMKISEEEGQGDIVATQHPEDDFARLIIPHKIYPSKLSQLKSNFVLKKNVRNEKNHATQEESVECGTDRELIIPTHNSKTPRKITEYNNGLIIEEL
ncbi:Sperm-associated antigen 1, partial [Pseudolycoriella hygida]